MGRIRLSQRAHNVSCLRSLRDIAFFSRFPAVFALMSMPSPFMSEGSASSDCIRTCRGRGGRDRPEGPFAFASGRPPVAAAPMPPPISRCRVTYTSRHWLITCQPTGARGHHQLQHGWRDINKTPRLSVACSWLFPLSTCLRAGPLQLSCCAAHCHNSADNLLLHAFHPI